MWLNLLPVQSVGPVQAPGHDLRHPGFVPGQLVEVRVQESQESGSLVIVIKGIPFHASSVIGPLRPGHSFQARVEQAEGPIVLNIMAPLSAPASVALSGISGGSPARVHDPVAAWLKELLPVQGSVTDGLDRLIAALRRSGSSEAPLLPHFEALRAAITLDPRELNGARIEAALRRLGLQHEHDLLARLAGSNHAPAGHAPAGPTLKSILLALVETYGHGPIGKTAERVREAEKVLHVLERIQVLTILNGPAGGVAAFELPLGDRSAHVYIEPEAGRDVKGAHDRTHRVVTLLALPTLGLVRAEALLASKQISVRILVERPDVESLVAASLPALEATLAAQGYMVASLSAGQAAADVLAGEDLKARVIPDRNLINLSV
ncbi:flagellar hook-length control protein FliK [Candidatus Nitrospira bockiana]